MANPAGDPYRVLSDDHKRRQFDEDIEWDTELQAQEQRESACQGAPTMEAETDYLPPRQVDQMMPKPNMKPQMHDPIEGSIFNSMPNAASQVEDNSIDTGSRFDSIETHPYAFTPEQLGRMFNPKSFNTPRCLDGYLGSSKSPSPDVNHSHPMTTTLPNIDERLPKWDPAAMILSIATDMSVAHDLQHCADWSAQADANSLRKNANAASEEVRGYCEAYTKLLSEVNLSVRSRFQRFKQAISRIGAARNGTIANASFFRTYTSPPSECVGTTHTSEKLGRTAFASTGVILNLLLPTGILGMLPLCSAAPLPDNEATPLTDLWWHLAVVILCLLWFAVAYMSAVPELWYGVATVGWAFTYLFRTFGPLGHLQEAASACVASILFLALWFNRVTATLRPEQRRFALVGVTVVAIILDVVITNCSVPEDDDPAHCIQIFGSECPDFLWFATAMFAPCLVLSAVASWGTGRLSYLLERPSAGEDVAMEDAA